MDLAFQYFTSSKIASLSGWSTKEIQNMSARGIFVGHQGGGLQGKHFKYSWNNVMEAACGKSLYDIGLSKPAVAIKAAMKFSHSGHGPSGWGREPHISLKSRRPGFPYHHNLGETILYISGDRSAVHLHAEDNVTLSEIGTSLLRPVGYISLNVSTVFKIVCSRLGRHPNEVLDQIYPEVAS